MLWLALLAATLAFLAQPAVSGTGDRARSWAFAFADSAGTQVLALSEIAHPEDVHVLLAADGRQFPVEYVRLQPPSDADTGREAAYNFENCAGQLYRLVGARVWPDETCFLTTDSLLTLGQPLPLDRDYGPAEDHAVRQVATSKGRTIKAAWKLATLSDYGGVWLCEFQPNGLDRLATLVLRHDGFAGTHDYPTRSTDPASAWRVDDQGELCSKCFTALFVLRGKAGYWVGVNWAGVEGESLHLLWSDGAEALTDVGADNRYWAAM